MGWLACRVRYLFHRSSASPAYKGVASSNQIYLGCNHGTSSHTCIAHTLSTENLCLWPLRLLLFCFRYLSWCLTVLQYHSHAWARSWSTATSWHWSSTGGNSTQEVHAEAQTDAYSSNGTAMVGLLMMHIQGVIVADCSH